MSGFNILQSLIAIQMNWIAHNPNWLCTVDFRFRPPNMIHFVIDKVQFILSISFLFSFQFIFVRHGKREARIKHEREVICLHFSVSQLRP